MHCQTPQLPCEWSLAASPQFSQWDPCSCPDSVRGGVVDQRERDREGKRGEREKDRRKIGEGGLRIEENTELLLTGGRGRKCERC